MNCKPALRDYDMTGLQDFLVTINDFKIYTQIGRGGYGEVFVGIHIKTGRKVAIKKLIFSRLEGQDLIYFNREVQILASCNNHFLLPFIGYSNIYPYIIVTDFIPCGSLFEALRHKRGSPILTDTIKTKIALGIAIGMIVLHDKNIIHRDLKSLNILINEETLPKICDFGIARFSDSINPGSQQNFFTANIGTPHWMAPEILQSGHYTNKVDVFSYAVILWEMLTEDLPFKGMKEHYQVALKIVSGERNYLPPNTPSGLRDLISKLWSQDPNLRPDFREVYRCFASHEAFYEKTNSYEIDEFVKRFPMPEKPVPGEESHFNSDHGINSNKYSKQVDQNAESFEPIEYVDNSDFQNSTYKDSIKQKLSEGPSKPVRPPKEIQPVRLEPRSPTPQQVKTTITINQAPAATNQSSTNQQSTNNSNMTNMIHDNERNQSNKSEIIQTNATNMSDNLNKKENCNLEGEKKEKDAKPNNQHQFLYSSKYLTKDNIFLQYFTGQKQPSFLDGINNNEIIEEEEEENEIENIQNSSLNNNNNGKKRNQSTSNKSSSSSDDDENYNEILNGGDSSIVANFGQLSVRFHMLIKKITPNNSKELINTISLLLKIDNRSIVFATIFTEISLLVRKDPSFINLLIETKILDYLPFERIDLFKEILHIVVAVAKKEPELVTDKIMRNLFDIFTNNLRKQQLKINDESKKDFDRIIDAETKEAYTNSKKEIIITDELKLEVIPFLCILEQIGSNFRYRDAIFEMYKEKIDIFINFSQFIDIIFYLSQKFDNFTSLQKYKINVFFKAISLSSTDLDDKRHFDFLNIIQSGYRSLARLNNLKYSTIDIPVSEIFIHLKESGQFTIEGLIIISKLDFIPFSYLLIEALSSAINFSEKASLIVASIATKMSTSYSGGSSFIYKSKIWLQIPPQYGMKLILTLATNHDFYDDMITNIEMPKYLMKALRLSSSNSSTNNNSVVDEQKRIDLVCSAISFVRYSKKFKEYVDKYEEAGFLHTAVDYTICSNNEKCIDQGLLLFDQLFHDGVWYNDFSYFVEKITKVLANGPPKQVQRSVVVLLALGVMFPQSHPIMKDHAIGQIASKISCNANSIGYRDNLIQILNQ